MFKAKTATAIILSIISSSAIASWGAWDEESSLRPPSFSQLIAADQAAELAGLYSHSKDGKSVVNYETSTVFKSGKDKAENSFNTKTIGRLTRTPLANNRLHYEMQPLTSHFRNKEIGEIGFFYPNGARLSVIDRNPKTEMLMDGNLPLSMRNSVNAAIAASEKPSFIARTESAEWRQKVGIDESKATDATNFKVRHLKDGTFANDYSVHHLSFETNEGLVTVEAKGFAVTDENFNVSFLNGFSFEGFIHLKDGTELPVRGAQITRAQSILYPSSINDEMNDQAKNYLSVIEKESSAPQNGLSTNQLKNIYAEISPAMEAWNSSSLAVAEHRSNNPALLAYAAWATADSTITLGVNAIGAVTGNADMVSYSGPTAAAVGALTSLVNGNSQETYLGKTQQDWAQTVVGVAMGVSSMTGSVKLASTEALQLMGREAAASNSIVATASGMAMSAANGAAGYIPEIARFGRSAYSAATGMNSIRQTINDFMPVYKLAAKGLMPDGQLISATNPIAPNVPAAGGTPNAGAPNAGGNYASGSIFTDNYIALTPYQARLSITSPLHQTGSPSVILGSGIIDVHKNGNTIVVAADGVLSSFSSFVLSPGDAMSGYNPTQTLWGWVDIQSQNVLGTVANPLAGLQYARFGVLQQMDLAGNDYHSAWSVGISPTQVMPQTGSATYTGKAVGSWYGTPGSFYGTSLFNVNFQNATMTGSFNYNSGPTFTSSLSATINGNGFTGVASAPGIAASGAVTGHFYGPSANELSGTMNLVGTNHAVVVAFGAKQ